jgi:hypothetical protein
VVVGLGLERGALAVDVDVAMGGRCSLGRMVSCRIGSIVLYRTSKIDRKKRSTIAF